MLPPRATASCNCGQDTCDAIPQLAATCPAGIKRRLVVNAVCKQVVPDEEAPLETVAAIEGKRIMQCITPSQGLQIPTPSGIATEGV